MKSNVILLIFVILVVGFLPANFIFAQESTVSTIQELQQRIAELQKQIVDLQAQLEIVKKTEVSATKNITFTKTLQRGMKDDEVKQLQEFLKQYLDIYPEGLFTGYFGPLTEAAVKKFQEKYGIESLGIVGPKTRAKLNDLFSAKPISPEEKTKPDEKTVKLEEKKEVLPTPMPDITKPITPLTPQFQSGPPATWPEWLKQERENNIVDVLEAEEKAEKKGRLSLQNENLPQFIEWAEERGIKLVGIRGTGGVWPQVYFGNRIWNPVTDEISLTAVSNIDKHFEDLKKIPPHLINLLRGQAIIFSSSAGLNWAQTFWREAELSRKYQKIVSGLPEDVRYSGCIYIPENIFGYYDPTPRCPFDIFLTGPGFIFHEFGHIVDFNGIRMYKGREFALGKTDEGIRELYNEFKRVFGVTRETRERWKNATGDVPGFLLASKALYADFENFAVHFDQYINNPQYFRERMVNEPALLEKYEFLKNKIFLGQEY